MSELKKRKPQEEMSEKAPRASSDIADSELEKVSGGFGLGADPQPPSRGRPGQAWHGWSRPNG